MTDLSALYLDRGHSLALLRMQTIHFPAKEERGGFRHQVRCTAGHELMEGVTKLHNRLSGVRF